MPGVIRTRVGYAGGSKHNPTYHNLGRHTETLEIDFLPDQITYEELLEIVWSLHDPKRSPVNRQYASAIFYRSDQQRLIIKKTLETVHSQTLEDVDTMVIPLDRFYRAEDYHQKYQLRQSSRLNSFFQKHYSAEKLVNSTVAARINGFLSGFGSRQLMDDEWKSYGLPDDWRNSLSRRIHD